MYRLLLASLFAISAIVLIFQAEAAPEKPVEKNNALIAFQTEFPTASVLLDDSTGLPIMIANVQSQPWAKAQPPVAALQIAYDFLREHVELLIPGSSPSEFELQAVQQSRNAEHVHFQQVYRGVPVYRGVVSVHIQEGRVAMYTGSYHPTGLFSNLSLQPSLGESQAESIAMRWLGGTGAVPLRGKIERHRYIYRADDGQYHLSYQILIPALAPLGDWELLIDAHTGAVLQQHNLLRYTDGAEQPNTSGTGSIYEENPMTTRPPVNRALPHLDDSGFLKGDFVDVQIYKGETGVYLYNTEFNDGLTHNAFSANRDFRYDTTDVRFDEANVYFHINRIHDHFKERFDFTGLDFVLSVIVRHPAIDGDNRVSNEPMNNAYFSPLVRRMGVGSGTGTGNGGLSNLARDADVLYHEYTHAVLYRIIGVFGLAGDFGGAIEEGLADYFACAYFNDPDMGEWAVLSERGMRNLDNNNRFPDDIYRPGTGAPERHYTGLIFGGACWRLRTAIGGQAADRIIFNSLYYLPRGSAVSFQVALTALLEADRSLYDGLHEETIRQVFSEYGIYESTGRPLVSGERISNAISGVELLGLNYYTLEVPNAEGTLRVDLQAVVKSRDIDLYVRFNEPVQVVQRREAAPEIIADHRSESEGGVESITIGQDSEPKLQTGAYYVAIINRDEAPRSTPYALTATLTQPPPSIEPEPPEPELPTVQLILTPSTATVEAGQQQQFHATVEGADSLAVVWQINGVPGGNASVGTITSDGVYTAPETVPDPNLITIAVISETDPSIRAEIQVTLVPGTPLPPPIEPVVIPKRSALLPNYPNPFNPETWLPYQLAKPAQVVISIYDVHGQRVRQLDLGHKAAGMYISREAAAHWDGRNDFGEVVGNGVYFYHLEGWEFQATRRMAVVK